MQGNQVFIFGLVKMGVMLGLIMGGVPMLIWLERKLIARFQVRIGPNRVGKFGLLQSFADGIKLLSKEDILPTQVDRTLYFLAPIVLMIPALSLIAAIPFGGPIGPGEHQRLVISNMPVGVLFVLAISSLSVYGIVMAGWAANNKYSLLGGLRSCAQMISYELPMGLCIVAGLLICSSRVEDAGGLLLLNLNQVIEAQKGGFWHWNLFWYILPGLVAGTTYYICGMAETNRVPFDLPEAETELVAGYHTEYSSMKFAMFFMAEYANMLNIGAIFTTLFLGGWQSPLGFPITQALGAGMLITGLEGFAWFSLKVMAIIVIYIWVRATLPRFRYDQLMSFAWTRLLPVSIVNLLIIALIITAFSPQLPIPDSVKRAVGLSEPASAQPLILDSAASGPGSFTLPTDADGTDLPFDFTLPTNDEDDSAPADGADPVTTE